MEIVLAIILVVGVVAWGALAALSIWRPSVYERLRSRVRDALGLED